MDACEYDEGSVADVSKGFIVVATNTFRFDIIDFALVCIGWLLAVIAIWEELASAESFAVVLFIYSLVIQKY